MIQQPKIKIVQLARIPCANSGLELCNLINTYSDTYECRYILGSDYSKECSTIPFRSFPTDLSWKTQKDECLQVIKDADILHIHHDWDFEAIEHLLIGKKVIITLYNLVNSLQFCNDTFNNNYIKRLKKYCNVFTVADQPLQKKLFSDITTLSVPLIKNLFNEKIVRNNQIPHVVFAPTNRDRAGVGKKMYYEVIDIIKKLQIDYKFTFDLIEGVPYDENLERKRKADIIIDDVDPEYEKQHNTSLEAACFGAVALTNFSSEEYPFYKTNIHTLENTLINFFITPNGLKEYQKSITKWRKENYTPKKLLEVYENLYAMEVNQEVKSHPDLTVFLISCGDNPNYPYCLQALQNQTISFNLKIIKDVAPMAKAFQVMLDTCTTPYYCEVDEDMILSPDAINIMYQAMKSSYKNTAMICFDLKDVHLNIPIQGVKIYKHDIFKKYPYNQTCLSCEMEQLKNLKRDGYTYQLTHIVVGEHSPYWTDELIFDRYFIFMQKNQWDEVIPRVFDIYNAHPTSQNRFALLGAIAGLLSNNKIQDKNFTEHNPNFQKIKTYFDKIGFKDDAKKEEPLIVPNTSHSTIEKLQLLNIKFWYLKKTCLYIVNKLSILPPILSIGVRTEEEKRKILLVIPVGIEIVVDSRQPIKPWDLNAYVPVPVVTYLANMFGPSWKDLTN